MIESAGFRYALRTPTARVAQCLAGALAASYALYGAQAAAGGMGLSRPVVTTIQLLCALLYTASAAGVFILYGTFKGAGKQQIAVQTLVEDTAASRRWVPRLLRSAWVLQSAVWLAPLVVVGVSAAMLVGAYGGGIAHGVAEVAATALMAWHARAALRWANSMVQSAQRGDGQPYSEFDWNQFDVSDDARFRRRFDTDRWKPPHSITHPVEADQYALRARGRRINYLGVSALAALGMVVFAQRLLSDYATKLAYDFTHLSAAPQLHDPSWKQIFALMGAMVLFLTPIGLQHSVSEMDTLAKLYDDAGTELRAQLRAKQDAAEGEPL